MKTILAVLSVLVLAAAASAAEDDGPVIGPRKDLPVASDAVETAPEIAPAKKVEAPKPAPQMKPIEAYTGPSMGLGADSVSQSSNGYNYDYGYRGNYALYTGATGGTGAADLSYANSPSTTATNTRADSSGSNTVNGLTGSNPRSLTGSNSRPAGPAPVPPPNPSTGSYNGCPAAGGGGGAPPSANVAPRVGGSINGAAGGARAGAARR